ncbi:MAG: DNA-directed RNA polymerase subunit alpha [Candidatus Komeilibacteria bacterium]|nr:DNA-directed RNA polymerase subunit alpha [Candidatus Komeilibacteria bacterium]
MITITPPDKINFKSTGTNRAQAIIEPCYPGFGVTIGNSLRRILLSSLDGAAISGFKIAGVDHEFSSIDKVKEDVVDIILNLKKVHIKVHADADEDIKLTLSASGAKTVTAGDITPNSNVEVVNADQVIATLTDKSAKFDMEIFVRRGRGYVTVEQREKEQNEIGTIAIDMLFSPVLSVGFRIENTRVGEMTNFEKLILDIETDGSVSPQDAFAEAARIMVSQFSVFLKEGAVLDEASVTAEEPIAAEEASEDVVAEKVEELEEKPKKRGRPKKSDK